MKLRLEMIEMKGEGETRKLGEEAREAAEECKINQQKKFSVIEIENIEM